MTQPVLLHPLPPTFATTREALRALACYVLAPARKLRTGRIGLQPFGDGFATPPIVEGARLGVEADELRWIPGEALPITTVRAGAVFAGVELTADPGVGDDLPPFEPDVPLPVDAEASRALGAWYAFGQRVLDEALPGAVDVSVSEATLWPEHFDLAVVVGLGGGANVNVGASPGDTYHDDPYFYVGPHDVSALDGDFWNAPFGALLPYSDLLASPSPLKAATDLVTAGIALVRGST